ncbi:MAG: 16S rRNA (guanine(966)-N(2))-methyltransferase RsmD [Tractidigestivibacter sp.]|jgi:16S rRNA (guanine966-N2)-methyltransferase|uniref:16S rRNA (guanine(966)-N(2))-methyltransferase RsmD n=1 Tax=Tractidigestivibacter sp. TaxID=2847320 RepID=UPI003D8E707B
MRVVGGKWRGKPLEAPDGRAVTRPTTDRNREAMASMILSAKGLDLAGCSVLDAFAGSGAMGIELLSRGAARCTFFDRDRRAAARIRRNCASVGAARDEYCVVAADVVASAAKGQVKGAPFDIVFLDPPYAMDAGAVSSLVESLSSSGSLALGAVVVYERSTDANGLSARGLVLKKSKRYGITSVDLMKMEGTVDEH